MTYKELETAYVGLLQKMERLEMKVAELAYTPIIKLTDIQEFELGRGTVSVKMSKDGLWAGKNKYSEAATSTPAGTAISSNGDFYPKGGVTGSFVADGGSPTIQVVRGIVTSIT